MWNCGEDALKNLRVSRKACYCVTLIYEVASPFAWGDPLRVSRAIGTAIAVLMFSQPAVVVLAQDSLRIIELSQPGQSAPLHVPAGYAFTFSLFSPEAASADAQAAVGLVSYELRVPYTYESNFGPDGSWLISGGEYVGWYLGPAQVSLKGSSAGARMQLYMMKLPSGVVSGILHADSPTHSVEVRGNSLLTPLLGFDSPTQFRSGPQRQFISYLSITNPEGVTYGVSKIDNGWGVVRQAGTPRIRGLAALHNPNALGSRVVRGFYYDDLDSVSPTADFVGPGTATFSLPPEGERSTPLAFYCYRLTPVSSTYIDFTPPTVTLIEPASGDTTTELASYIVRGTVTDDRSPTSIRFRVLPPGASAFGKWTSANLAGSNRTKNWTRRLTLATRGSWLIEIQAFDGQGNGSEVTAVTMNRL
jgi:hypothetical protein